MLPWALLVRVASSKLSRNTQKVAFSVEHRPKNAKTDPKDPKRSHLLQFAHFCPKDRFATPLPPQNQQNASKNGQNRPFARLCSFSASARWCACPAPIRTTRAPNRTTAAPKRTTAAPKRTKTARIITRKIAFQKSPNGALSAPLVPPITNPKPPTSRPAVVYSRRPGWLGGCAPTRFGARKVRAPQSTVLANSQAG